MTKLFTNIYSPVRFSLNLARNKIKPNLGDFIKRYVATKRFYKKANVLYNDGKFEVTLDQRKLKTPKGKLFYVESEPLALAVAEEWDKQENYIVSSSMHLTGLCYTVLDNPNKLTKEDIVQNIIRYLDTDTVLYTSSEEDDLYELQLKEWQPVINWFCKNFNIDIKPSRDISGPEISSDAKATVEKYLSSFNFSSVHGFLFAIEALKSVILGLACAQRHISVERAVLLSRLEEEFQGKRWGRIEWSHELNQQDTQARVSAGILFAYFNSSSTITKNKAEVI